MSLNVQTQTVSYHSMVQQTHTFLTQATSDSNLPHIRQMYKLQFIQTSLKQSAIDSNLSHKSPLIHTSLMQADTDLHLPHTSQIHKPSLTRTFLASQMHKSPLTHTFLTLTRCTSRH